MPTKQSKRMDAKYRAAEQKTREALQGKKLSWDGAVDKLKKNALARKTARMATAEMRAPRKNEKLSLTRGKAKKSSR